MLTRQTTYRLECCILSHLKEVQAPDTIMLQQQEYIVEEENRILVPGQSHQPSKYLDDSIINLKFLNHDAISNYHVNVLQLAIIVA